MTGRCKFLLISCTIAAGLLTNALGQDSPSLGDLARRQREQQAADAKDGKTPKVITNEEIPERAVKPASRTMGDQNSFEKENSSTGRAQAEYWRTQIHRQEEQITSLTNEIADVNGSVRFAAANCAGRCVEWNERQRQKQERVERMQAQLEEQKKRLEDMQESARKAGFGSSVYEP